MQRAASLRKQPLARTAAVSVDGSGEFLIRLYAALLFGGVQFKEYGVFHVEILLDDQLIIRYPLPVVKVTLPGQSPTLPPVV